MLECLLPLNTRIINKSLAESDVPAYFKKAHFRAVIKKPNPDKEMLENYRPMSNLPLLSKILEKVVSTCLEGHFEYSEAAQ